MDVYRQASDIIRIVREGNGTAKALCLRKDMQKKKQTYAVVCETLRHYELLEDVLEVAEFFKYYPQANKEFAMCMAYDVVIGKGVNTKNDTTARAVSQSASYLREAYWQVYKHHHIPPRSTEKFDEKEAEGEDGARKTGVIRAFPRYARVNTLKISTEELVSRLRRSTEARKRSREEEEEDQEAAEPYTELPEHQKKRKGPRKVLPNFTVDPVVPDLLVFPPGTDLHAHPAVRSGQLILQDRSSCLPAAILLEAVPVARSYPNAPTEKQIPEYVVDACAAPGNKTTQLAALGAPGVKIMATERDERRAELLNKRVTVLGAADYINVVNMDFFQLSSDDRNATEAILLDPSCSASGVISRVDVAVQQHRRQLHQDSSNNNDNHHHSNQKSSKQASGRAAEEEDEYADGEEPQSSSGAINPADQSNEFSMNDERVTKLSRLQRKLLAHSLLSFDNCRTVVYSTCSVHEEENEDVVREVLNDARVRGRGWTLTNIMPTTWRTRGLEKESDKEEGSEGAHPLRYTIRCDPAGDATNGFFVARFDRPAPSGVKAPASAEKTSKKKQNKKDEAKEEEQEVNAEVEEQEEDSE